MLKKMVDGKEVICSEQEEADIRAFWALNETYPEYHDAVRYDGASSPYVDMNRAKELHLLLLKKKVEAKIKDINIEIEIAEENENENHRKLLIAKRQNLKKHLNADFSMVQTLEDLKNKMPQELL